MPNQFAYFALLSWPLMTIFLIRRYGIESGGLMSLLGCYMFLPAAFSIDLPDIPSLNKFTVTIITLLAYLLVTRRQLGFGELSWFMKLVFIVFLISPFLTAVTNPESDLYLRGLTLYDGFSEGVNHFLVSIPFLFGVKYFRSYEKQLTLFKYFVIAAVIYAFLSMYEVKMSPQLHVDLYGYFPHSWLQQYRDGGYRAVVFMGHGLLVALFLALGLAFSLTTRKLGLKVLPVKNISIVLLVLLALVLAKSFGALMYGLFFLVVINFMSAKRMHQAGVLISILFISYPILSTMHLFPHTQVINYAADISPERASSLNFRFKQEKSLLHHAIDKPLFGWGGWGRNRVHNKVTGADESVTDGGWILTLGTNGWLGFLSQYLFIIWPLWLAYRRTQKNKPADKGEALALGAHAVILSIILLDQIPNASLNPLYWLVAGSLLGRAYEIKDQNKNGASNSAEDTLSQETAQKGFLLSDKDNDKEGRAK